MGMYTEIYVNVDLKEDTPDSILDVLRAMCRVEGYSVPDDLPLRWAYLFNDGSFYTPLTSCRNLTFNDISKQYSLLGKGDIKNYEGEIEKFFEWITPWVDAENGSFIGYSRYEDCQLPELYVLGSERHAESEEARWLGMTDKEKNEEAYNEL